MFYAPQFLIGGLGLPGHRALACPRGVRVAERVACSLELFAC